jgi:hypothetical protein
MRKLWLSFAALVCFLPVATRPSAVSAVLLAAPPGDLPVTSIISDYDSGVAPSLQIQSDQQGVYRNTKDVQSIIQKGGDWELDTAYSRFSTRAVALDFSQPIAGSGPNGGSPVAPPSGPYKVRFISKCHLYGSNMLTLAANVTTNCPLHLTFNAAGTAYKIQMNPVAGASVYPETNYVNVTCIFADSGSPCSQWKIWPSGTYVAADGTVYQRNVAKLVKTVTSKGQTVDVNQGDFYFSFLILVMNP